VLLVGGVAAGRGDATLVLVWLLAAGAAVTGDVVSVLMGRRLGRRFIERHRRRVGVDADRLARVDGFFSRHGGKAVALGRFTGFLRATLPFVAGSSGVALRRLLPFSLGSALAWTALFTGLGYAFSESIESAGDTATRVALIVVVLGTAAFVVRAGWQRRRRPPVSAPRRPT
jgi:membrane-associated protein